MAPSADVLALASTEVDVSKIAAGPGDQGSVAQAAGVRPQPDAQGNRRGQRGAAGELRDPQTLAERTKPGKPNWLITMGVCTHLGCVPLGTGEGRTAARSAAISARATVRSTTPRRASAKARRRKIWKCRNINSRRRPRSQIG